jgi:hypothetical protein
VAPPPEARVSEALGIRISVPSKRTGLPAELSTTTEVASSSSNLPPTMRWPPLAPFVPA